MIVQVYFWYLVWSRLSPISIVFACILRLKFGLSQLAIKNKISGRQTSIMCDSLGDIWPLAQCWL